MTDKPNYIHVNGNLFAIQEFELQLDNVVDALKITVKEKINNNHFSETGKFTATVTTGEIKFQISHTDISCKNAVENLLRKLHEIIED